jgi:hypothetical protein
MADGFEFIQAFSAIESDRTSRAYLNGAFGSFVCYSRIPRRFNLEVPLRVERFSDCISMELSDLGSNSTVPVRGRLRVVRISES